MTDRPRQPIHADRDAREAGFTLMELMFALGILVFGITSLIGVLSVGVSTRRTAEQRARSTLVIEQVLHRIENEILAGVPLENSLVEDPSELVIEPIEGELAADDSSVKYSIRFKSDVEMPELVLATIHVSWLEQGETVAQVFHRILPRQVPFSQRVAKQRRSP